MNHQYKLHYNHIAEEWSQARQSLPYKDQILFDTFLQNLTAAAAVLDLGCGTGIPIARALCEQGFSVTGVDCSQKMLARAVDNVPVAQFMQADIEHFISNDVFQAVVLWDAIFHLPRTAHTAVLQRIHDTLSDGGFLLMSSGGTETEIPPFTDSMFNVEFFYDSLTPRQLITACEDIGFSVVENVVLDEPDGGRNKGRIGLLLKKP